MGKRNAFQILFDGARKSTLPNPFDLDKKVVNNIFFFFFFIHFHIFHPKKTPTKNGSLITFYSSKKKKKNMPPSLINFDKKGPENQVINFAWPYFIYIAYIQLQKKKIDYELYKFYLYIDTYNIPPPRYIAEILLKLVLNTNQSINTISMY